MRSGGYILQRPARDEPVILAPIGAKFESAIVAGVHHGVRLWQGTRRIFERHEHENAARPRA